MEAFFVISGIVFLILWAYELYESRNLRMAYELTISAVNDFTNGFEELKGVINTNADTLRMLRLAVDRHDKALSVMDALIDVHGQALGVQALRTSLESEEIEGYPIEGA